MPNVGAIKNLCQHIVDCADIWEKTGVSRVKTITRTADEIRQLVQPVPDQARDHIHPASVITLRQLVKLHGAENVINAVNELAKVLE